MLNNRKEFKEIFAIQPLDGSKGRIELGEARFDRDVVVNIKK